MTTPYRPSLVCPSCRTPHRVVCENGAWRFVRHTRSRVYGGANETCPAAPVTVGDVVAATEHEHAEADKSVLRARDLVDKAVANHDHAAEEASRKHAAIFRFVGKLRR